MREHDVSYKNYKKKVLLNYEIFLNFLGVLPQYYIIIDLCIMIIPWNFEKVGYLIDFNFLHFGDVEIILPDQVDIALT